MKVLVTGGAGFIGSHTVDALLRSGHTPVVLDSLVEQVHPERRRPDFLDSEVEFIEGDVRDRELLDGLLRRVDGVIHLAAEVGVGQSMYEVHRYIDGNVGATATLLDLIVNKYRDLDKLVVASSMSIYGEGQYASDSLNRNIGARRTQDLDKRVWDVLDQNGEPLTPVPTNEQKALDPSSIYAISKMDQELYCLNIGKSYNIPVTALRYFNAYGPRQALGNPYTGVAAIFCNRLLNGLPPLINEDGEQLRDFVHVSDVANANVLALTNTTIESNAAINVGSGEPVTIKQVANRLAEALDIQDVLPEYSGNYRVGDIRHCYADISLAKRVLGFSPNESFMGSGVDSLISWVLTQEKGRGKDGAESAARELRSRGLSR